MFGLTMRDRQREYFYKQLDQIFFPACLPDIGKRMDTTMVAILLWQNYYGRSLSEPAGNAR